jgi:transcription elongation GreA/GreB family factor
MQSDLQKGILSVASPLGGVLHWKKEGDVVQAGPHHIEYLIEKIE